MLMTVKQACAYAAIGRTSCYAYLARGELEAARIGNRTLVTKRSLDAFIERAIARAQAERAD